MNKKEEEEEGGGRSGKTKSGRREDKISFY